MSKKTNDETKTVITDNGDDKPVVKVRTHDFRMNVSDEEERAAAKLAQEDALLARSTANAEMRQAAVDEVEAGKKAKLEKSKVDVEKIEDPKELAQAEKHNQMLDDALAKIESDEKKKENSEKKK